MNHLFEEIFSLPENQHASKFPVIDSILDIGKLHVTTNTIVACDPLYDYDVDVPFTQKVPNGDFPVKLYYTDDDAWGLRVSYAVLRFSDMPIKTWQMAVLEEEDTKDLGEGEFFGYVVEAGMGCFKDERAAAIYGQKISQLHQENGKEFNHYDDYVEQEMKKQNEYDYLNLFPDSKQPHNVIMFSSGVGDGSYPSYFGFDEAGDVVCLLTDFLLFSNED